MVDQNLLTLFVALTALAVLIQTGILIGFYIVSLKLSRQADQAINMTRNVVGPIQTVAENIQGIFSRWRRPA
jgi:ribosomal protein S28E/S33